MCDCRLHVIIIRGHYSFLIKNPRSRFVFDVLATEVSRRMYRFVRWNCLMGPSLFQGALGPRGITGLPGPKGEGVSVLFAGNYSLLLSVLCVIVARYLI